MITDASKKYRSPFKTNAVNNKDLFLLTSYAVLDYDFE